MLKLSEFLSNLTNFLLFIPIYLVKLIWNIFVIISSIGLTIAWIGFIFGSVIGVILLLIFMGLEGFFLPMALLSFCVPLDE